LNVQSTSQNTKRQQRQPFPGNVGNQNSKTPTIKMPLSILSDFVILVVTTINDEFKYPLGLSEGAAKNSDPPHKICSLQIPQLQQALPDWDSTSREMLSFGSF